MLKKIIFIAAGFIFLLPPILMPQMTQLDIYADNFTYKDPGAQRYLTDINVKLPEDQLKKLNFFSLDTVEIICEIYEDSKTLTKGWHCFSLKGLKQSNSSRDILDLFTFALKEGDYTFSVKIYPRNSKVPIFGSDRGRLNIAQFSTTKVADSDILIADQISKPPTDNGKFVKSGLWIQPFPEREFSTAQPLLYYYWEVYHLDPNRPEEYRIEARIENDNGFVKKLNRPRQVFADHKTIYLAGQNIIALKGGDFDLVLSLYQNDKLVSRRETPLTMYKKEKVIVTLDENTASQIDSLYLPMTAEEIDDEIKKLKYIMKQKTFEKMGKMNLLSKKISLTQFWKANNYVVETEHNEFREYYMETVKYVREYFSDSNFNVDGIDTDMGRIVLLYGKPDVINREIDDDMAGRAVELWKIYKFQAEFLFVQENFIGPYRLVYSTMKGEVREPKWAAYLANNPEIRE